jgi:hypothetical protein
MLFQFKVMHFARDASTKFWDKKGEKGARITYRITYSIIT